MLNMKNYSSANRCFHALRYTDKGDENGPKKDLSIKGIVGCELSICRDHSNKDTKDNGKAMVFLAKNKEGYHNLSKMSSLAFTDGFYYVPRIDKEIVSNYKKDLIVISGGISGEISDLILSVGERQA
jgi:DNA polymerase-3 subunit alpha